VVDQVLKREQGRGIGYLKKEMRKIMNKRKKKSTPSNKNVTPSQMGNAFMTVLSQRGIKIYAPGTHPGTGYGWGYFDDMPEEENSGFASLTDMIEAYLLSIEYDGEEEDEEDSIFSPDFTAASYEMVSQGVELVAAALHFAPNVPIPHELLVATALDDPSDMEDVQKVEAVVRSVLSMVEQGILEATPDGEIIVSTMFQEGIARTIQALDMPLIIGQERAEQALIMLVPDLFQDPDGVWLLEAIEPHLRHVTTVAQGRSDLNAISLSIVLARYLIWAEEPHQVQQTIEQLFALLDLDVLQEYEASDTILAGDEIFYLGETCAEQQEDPLYQNLARACFERALAIRQQFLPPLDLDTADVFAALGDLANGQNDPHTALDFYRNALYIYEQNNEPYEIKVIGFVEILASIGKTFLAMQDIDEAQAQFQRIVDLSNTYVEQEHLAQALQADALNSISILEYHRGNIDRAVQLLQETLTSFQPEIDDFSGILIRLKLLTTLSMFSLEQGNASQAATLIREMLTIREQSLDDDSDVSEALRADLEHVLANIEQTNELND
jgi:tetratricopeptide (TPR) repeat protein